MTFADRLASLPRAGLAAAIAFAAFVALAIAVVSEPVGNLVRDVMVSTVSPFDQPPKDIVVVAIDEKTLEKFPYRSPVDREFLARLVQRIAEAKPRVIGIDLLFDQTTEPSKDDALRQVITSSQVPTVVASAWASDGLTKAQLAHLAEFSPNAVRGLAALSRDPLDGVVRGAFAGRERDGEWQYSFPSAMALAGGITPSRQTEEMVYYRTANAEPWKVPVYPAAAAMVAPPSWFADKYVLIGVDLPLEDRHATPFVSVNGVLAGTLPGVVIHAHSLARLVSGDRIIAAGMWSGLALALGFGAAGAALAWRPMPLALKPVAILSVILLMWLLVVYLFASKAILVPAVAPSILVLAVSLLVGFLAWQRDQQERQFLKRAFSQYVSPAVVDAIVADPDQLKLGGERRMVTCVFTDLEGFTSFSENMPPERLAEVLNTYLDRICDLFVENGATIDKVIGDAVIGFFGAPSEQADQAVRAVGLALAIDRFSQESRAQMAKQGLSLGVTRIGVHSGPAIVGNFGGKRFFDYTAIGDTVNTAARLEGANKYIGTTICISGTVAQAAQGVLMRPSGVLYLKGKNEGVPTFEALYNSPENRMLCETWGRAWNLLETGSPQAKAAFSEIAASRPEDRLAAMHAARLERGESGPAIRLVDK